MSMFSRAVKTASKLRMAISGPSGGGKTYTALAIATALAQGKPIALMDTEHGSASKYADLFKFDVAEMHPPFHPDKFVAAVQEAADTGYAVIILDSLTHAWAGTGGVLDIVDDATRRSKSGNSYMAWKDGTPIHNRLIDGIVQSGIHVIGTMRSKTEYVLVAGNNGQQVPKKVGMAPEQRQNFEYEFDVVLDMDIDHNGIVIKSRCPELADGVFKKPGADIAKILLTWLQGAPAPVQKPPPPQPAAKTNGTTPPPAQTADVDMGMGGASPYKYADLIDRLSGSCVKLANTMREVHANSNGPASDAQYQYLAGVVDAIVNKKGAHNAILEVVVGRPVSGDNPCGKGLASKLLDYLVATKKVDDTEVANPNYREDVANCVKTIWTLCLEADGQLRLIEA